ncbi:DUF2141 domain-containing protein [Kovacikia minuta CCNUW1]|uniref:DUF2141 domain-containing protein n=1 Tax=Kovacikia minuta TaxID=2931930 RepID=UPI001CCB966F|nr:DUF2141 domain-containing protein [Kovacikia minuta]UBF28629.1 DUF2141 domain-containing protein [Kovacikia minuta CCNUW1]
MLINGKGGRVLLEHRYSILRNRVSGEDMQRNLSISQKKPGFCTGVLVTLAGLTFACSAKADFKGNLNVEVDGLQNQKGLLCVKLFSGSQGFPDSNEKAIKRQCVKISDMPMTFSFKNLTSGSYAVAVYHDLNGDGKLNRNSLGMPTEGYGFSNNPAPSRSGPPKFGNCVFLLAGPNTRVNIQMKYSVGS